MPESLPVVVVAAELVLLFAGAVLLWRHVLSPAARAQPAEVRLPAWELPVTDFAALLLAVMVTSTIAALAGGKLARAAGLAGDAATIAGGAAAQLGMLGGYFLFHLVLNRRPLVPSPPELPRIGRRDLVAGAGVFLMALPLLVGTAKLWELILHAAGLPAERQDLIRMFADAESPVTLAIMVALAVLIAPVTEELVFRAGLFRYLRTRLARRFALVAPALCFGALHVDWSTLRGLTSLAPLVVLAVIFSLAYERTGRIGTPIVAHALFNLNTVLLILGGVTD